LRSKRSDPATFLALPGRERVLALEAVLLLPLVELSLRRSGFDRTCRRLARLSRRRGQWQGPPEEVVPASVRMVSLSAYRTPVLTKCLARSLTLSALLGRRGVASEVVIGVRPGGEPLDAHAWVEVDGQPVNETQETVDSYARLTPGSSA
jgi:hypothetical protein